MWYNLFNLAREEAEQETEPGAWTFAKRLFGAVQVDSNWT